MFAAGRVLLRLTGFCFTRKLHRVVFSYSALRLPEQLSILECCISWCFIFYSFLRLSFDSHLSEQLCIGFIRMAERRLEGQYIDFLHEDGKNLEERMMAVEIKMSVTIG